MLTALKCINGHPMEPGQRFCQKCGSGLDAATTATLVQEVQAAKKKNFFVRHKILTGLGLLILIVVIAMSASGSKTASTASNSTGSNSNSSHGASTASRSTVAHLGQPVRDGKFEFTVSRVDCGHSQVGDQYANEKAQGQFCFVYVAVSNIGKEAQTLSADDQYAFDRANHKLSADSEAAIYADQSKTLYEDINPGNSVTGYFIFDIPKGDSITSFELHDSAYSNGVKVVVG